MKRKKRENERKTAPHGEAGAGGAREAREGVGADGSGEKAKRRMRRTGGEMKRGVWRKLRIGVPWLRIAMAILIGGFLTLEVSGVMIGRVGETEMVPATPMQRQARVPERIFRGNLKGKKLVALTFDDGPGAETTPRLLDILKEKQAVATFFELGSKARNNPDITRRAKEEGHEVGSHTMYHQNLIRVGRGAAEADINEARGVFREILGAEVKLTRMPYGNANEFTARVAGTPLIYWSVDTRDWAVLDAGMVEENAVGAAGDGAIILMHDIYNSTVDAVPRIIDRLRGEGYEFVTVSELAEERGVELANGVTYFKFEP